MTWEETEAKKYNQAYQAGYFPRNVIRFFEKEICNPISKAIQGHVKLLDIGCGPCFTSEIAKPYDIEVVGLDISNALIPYWEKHNINAVVAPSSNIPFDDSTFDIVMAWDVLEHIPEEGIVDTLLEIRRVIKPRGLFAFCICLTEEVVKFKNMQFHMTIKPGQWWLSLIKSVAPCISVGPAILDRDCSHIEGRILIEK